VTLEYVQTEPEPTTTWDGTIATITGVRYVWFGHCSWCRKAIEVWSDGGTVRVGIRESGRTVRWFREDEPPSTPSAPTKCPHCGYESEHGVCRFERVPSWLRRTDDAISAVYAQLRADHPDLTHRADRETRGTRWWTLYGGRRIARA